MLREYQERDRQGLLETWEEATRLAHPFLSEAFIEGEKRNIPELYLPNAETWVWEEEANVIGFLSLLGNEIGGLFVRPSAHKRGIGTSLVDQACKLRTNLTVEVFEANPIGRAFYAKYGFQLQDQSIHEPTGQPLLTLALK